MGRGGMKERLRYKTPSRKLFLRVCSPFAVGARVQPELVVSEVTGGATRAACTRTPAAKVSLRAQRLEGRASNYMTSRPSKRTEKTLHSGKIASKWSFKVRQLCSLACCRRHGPRSNRQEKHRIRRLGHSATTRRVRESRARVQLELIALSLLRRHGLEGFDELVA